jgi:tight adherence protein B
MTRTHLLLLLLAGLVLTVIAAAAGFWVLRLHDRAEAARKRITQISTAHSYFCQPQARSILRRQKAAPQPFVSQLARLFGYDPAGPDEGLRWYLVLPGTLFAAILVSQLAVSLVGSARFAAIIPCWVMMSRSLWGWRREKRLGLLRTQFPDALAMIVRSVRVGIPVSEAMRIVAHESRDPTASAFAVLADELAIGVPLEAALPRLAERSGLTEYRFFATAVSLQAQTGGGLSETLENLAEVIRRRAALRARGHALSSEARASCFVLAVLPFLVGGALYAMSPAYMGVLFFDPTGRHVLGLAVFALGTGLFAMYAIVKRVLAS